MVYQETISIPYPGYPLQICMYLHACVCSSFVRHILIRNTVKDTTNLGDFVSGCPPQFLPRIINPPNACKIIPYLDLAAAEFIHMQWILGQMIGLLIASTDYQYLSYQDKCLLIENVTRYIDGLVQERHITVFLMHWSYIFLALSHRYIHFQPIILHNDMYINLSGTTNYTCACNTALSQSLTVVAAFFHYILNIVTYTCHKNDISNQIYKRNVGNINTNIIEFSGRLIRWLGSWLQH